MFNFKNGNALWKWVMRACAVAGFVVVVTREGLMAPPSFYILLLGLFFGPEIITGKIKFFLTKEEDEDDDTDKEST